MPRWIPDEALVEITMRTQGARYLMRPSPALNRKLLGILGRALSMYPVVLYAFAFLSNHYHMLARALDGAALAAFQRYVNGQIARVIQTEARWDLRVWQRRAQVIEVLDEGSAVDRLRYILAQGAKEGLVASPHDWPGLTSARALCGNEQLVGTWRDETLASRIRSRGREPEPFEVDHVYPITLAPLPGWERFTPEQRAAMCAELVADIERDARLAHPVPLGVAGVLATDPHGAPEEPKRTPAPLVHASTPEQRIAYRAAYRAFVAAYRESSVEVRAGRAAWLVAPAFWPGSLHARTPVHLTLVGPPPPAPSPPARQRSPRILAPPSLAPPPPPNDRFALRRAIRDPSPRNARCRRVRRERRRRRVRAPASTP